MSNFQRTNWSMILAVMSADPAESAQALRQLCAEYSLPIYAYLRRSGHTVEDAEDLLQEFLASKVLTRRIFDGLQPRSGHFRSWLMTCLKNMVHSERDRRLAKKRGGRECHVPFDTESAEASYHAQLEPGSTASAEELYDRSYAVALVDAARETVRSRYHARGRGELYELIKTHLPGARRTIPYAEISKRVGREENYLRTEVGRLRDAFKVEVYGEIRRTVRDQAEAQDEFRYLLRLLGSV